MADFKQISGSKENQYCIESIYNLQYELPICQDSIMIEDSSDATIQFYGALSRYGATLAYASGYKITVVCYDIGYDSTGCISAVDYMNQIKVMYVQRVVLFHHFRWIWTFVTGATITTNLALNSANNTILALRFYGSNADYLDCSPHSNGCTGINCIVVILIQSKW